MKLKEKLIKNKTFKKAFVIVSIFLIVTFLYGFVLYKYDLTLINTYDYNYGLNPCTSENDYTWISEKVNCLIYNEEKIIYKIFGG